LRANLIVFGADQYRLPGQALELKLYFSMQMICIKIGSLLGRFVTPIFREDIKCFNNDDCYLLAFGVTSILLTVTLITMLSGKKFFVCNDPFGNVFAKVCRCMFYAIRKYFRDKSHRKHHWLDCARDKFDDEFIEATKAVLRIFMIFLPTSIYWAVFVQQGSRWTFQAMRMNGDLGFYTIKPDQMIAFNSLFSIILLPVCFYFFFPLLEKVGIKNFLHRITIGGFLCCISFLMAAVIELKIEDDFISILWLLPQFAILALSENFVYISSMDFAYSQTPNGMKSVMTAFVFLIIALGNLIITLISGFNLFNSQFYEFIFFSSLLFIDMLLFIVFVKFLIKN
jgi:dipeptide/tripeptide permease